MFYVNISSVFFIYLVVLLIFIFIVWLIDEFKSRTKRNIATIKGTIKCSLCMQNFIYEKNKTIIRCPYCGSLNDLNDFKN